MKTYLRRDWTERASSLGQARRRRLCEAGKPMRANDGQVAIHKAGRCRSAAGAPSGEVPSKAKQFIN